MVMNEALNQKIRDKARELWELEGCPEGRELLHWDMARELVTQENTAEFTLVPDPHPDGNDIVDPASALDNLREVPDLTHVGEEHAPGPDIEPGRPKKVAGGRF
jgi:hypothetical protein